MVPQETLDRLTRVEMPAMARTAVPARQLSVDGQQWPVYQAQVVVLGSGAAGLRAAVELQRRGVDVLLASMSPYGGTSACSGSDKQTLHTAGTSRRGDDFQQLAVDLGAGGCMDADAAYIESVGSLQAMEGLRYLGLPLPTDRFGAVLRYQTDHDAVGRATSCGPRTSRLMVQVLAREAIRLGVRCLPKCEAVRIVTEANAVAGLIAIDHEQRDQQHGLCLLSAPDVILATGGPGELYRDSVYPRHCYGSLGMALEAGVEVCNITESQFGIGTRRQEFPWNLSGTYAQAMPRLVARDAAGREFDVLEDWYRNPAEAASNLFRKGYQWPFHAERMLGFGSSLVDVAVFEQTRRGRTVFMDFLRNPCGFTLEQLDADARAYLQANQAGLETPIQRLQTMNPLAIELYKMHGADLTCEPLAFAVNNQHMNGGIAVDGWSRSSLPGLYAVGEVAGTHGVTRPGGSALNAGQVWALRAAEHIAAVPSKPLSAEMLLSEIRACQNNVTRVMSGSGGLDPAAVRSEIQDRMSDQAGFLCAVSGINDAQQAAVRLRQRVWRELRPARPSQVADLFRWRQQALVSEAVLTAMASYCADGGGSRGARAYLDAAGAQAPDNRHGLVEALRFRRERDQDKTRKLVVHFDGSSCQVRAETLRCHEDLAGIVFEKDWAAYLRGDIYRDGFAHRSV